MNPVNTLFADLPIAYTGEQLASHWIYRQFHIEGDAAVAFIGPCDVAPEHMRDLEDLQAGARIYSEKMLHIIIEVFGADLAAMVLRQHLLMASIAEQFNRRLNRTAIRRAGSDLYDGDKKVTVSVACVSPVSGLIHTGINISSRNTPVPTKGLEDYDLPAREFGEETLTLIQQEAAAMERARCKVRACP